MTFTLRTTAHIAGLTAALLLAACGGGGGGSGDTNTPPASTASTVTSSNVQDVSAEGVAAVVSLNGRIFDGSGLVTGATVDTASRPGLIDVALRQVYRALEPQAGASLVTGAAVSDTIACSGGGTLQVTTSISASGQLSAGDSASFTATNCVEDGSTLNGKLDIRFNSITGTPGESTAWSGALAVTFTGFAVTEGGETQSSSGDMLITISQTSFTSESLTVSGSKLTVAETKNGATVSRSITNYTYAGSDNAGLLTFNAGFTLAGTLPNLGTVSYTVKTLADFKQQGSAYPYQGSMKISGSDNSSVTVTAVDSTNVTIGLDSNGDGTIDSTTATTWAALDART